MVYFQRLEEPFLKMEGTCYLHEEMIGRLYTMYELRSAVSIRRVTGQQAAAENGRGRVVAAVNNRGFLMIAQEAT